MIRRFWRRLIQFSFHLLYNEFAFSYDAVSRLVSLGRWRAWQRSVLRQLDSDISGPVLELAHGTGDLQLDLLRFKYRTVALDLSPRMGQIAKRKLANHGLSTDFLRADVFTLPFKADCIPAIVCAFPTAFIAQASALSEMHRVLKANGCAFIVLSGILSGGGLLRWIIKLLYRLTGQSNDGNVAPFVSGLIPAAGFVTDLETLQLRDSIVHLLILRKAIQEQVPGGVSHLEMPPGSC